MINKIKQLLNNSTKKTTSTNARARSTTGKLPFSPEASKSFSSSLPVLGGSSKSIDKPKLSIVLIVFNMPEQAYKTLHSLSVQYQSGVSENDYEVIVIENRSSNNLQEPKVSSIGKNFKYFLRDETEPTPVHSANFGIQEARGEFVTLMIDGARMLTPGVVQYLLAAYRVSKHAIVAVPGYHLGHKLQQKAMLEGYNKEEEQTLLDSIKWPNNGYRLFEVSCLSGTSAGGFFRPFGESNCLGAPRELLLELGGFDKRFNETGGGQANLDLYKRLVEHPDSVLFCLPGEGSFHQFHGGVTTGQKGEIREEAMRAHFAQYAAIRGGAYKPPQKRPIYLGPIPDCAMKFLSKSAQQAEIIHAQP